MMMSAAETQDAIFQNKKRALKVLRDDGDITPEKYVEEILKLINPPVVPAAAPPSYVGTVSSTVGSPAAPDGGASSPPAALPLATPPAAPPSATRAAAAAPSSSADVKTKVARFGHVFCDRPRIFALASKLSFYRHTPPFFSPRVILLYMQSPASHSFVSLWCFALARQHSKRIA